jgi:acetyl/propionyl-CoA carboxylase alpha subunit
MTDAAIRAARAASYRNAGTIEFLIDPAGGSSEPRFYFLEMNTRLQVEHPVTEQVVGVDIVRAQLLIASGLPLPWNQADLQQRGHAIEARIYAEDPARDFLPQAGELLFYREPSGPGIRVDSGVSAGFHVPIHYDPLLAKIIASAETREAAIARLTAALRAYPILGITSNLAYLLEILGHPRFRAGTVDTHFLEAEAASLTMSRHDELPAAMRAALAAYSVSNRGGPSAGSSTPSVDPWERLQGWRADG